jgi:hypothetical protein
MRRRFVAILLLFGVFAGFGSAAFSAVRHHGGAHCERAGHDGHAAGDWGRHRAHRGPVTPEGGTIAP